MPGVDPTSSLRPFELIVTLGGVDYTIRAAYADEWLTILLERELDLSDIIPGMVTEEEQRDLADAAWRGDISDEEIEQACFEIIKETSGRDWWWVLHLLWSAAGAWMIVYGRMVSQGVDPTRIPLGAFLDAMYLMFVQNMDKEQRSEFDRMLEQPPQGVEFEEAVDEDAEASAFLNMMNQGM